VSKENPGYREVEHTADWELEVWAADLPGLLEQFDTRQALHVTFGSVLTTPALKDRLMAGLIRNEEVYYGVLERHFIRHLRPLRGVQ